MAANTLTQTFVTGASNQTQATALAAFNTALTGLQTFQGGPVTLVGGFQQNVSYNGTNILYTFSCFVSYYSAS